MMSARSLMNNLRSTTRRSSTLSVFLYAISGLKSIWPRWRFSISLAWSNGALLTGGGNRKSFRPSGSHTHKGLANSRSERGGMEMDRLRRGEEVGQERGGWQVRKYRWETGTERREMKCGERKKRWERGGRIWNGGSDDKRNIAFSTEEEKDQGVEPVTWWRKIKWASKNWRKKVIGTENETERLSIRIINEND